MNDEMSDLNQKIDDLNKNVLFLQDLVLKMKFQLDLLTKTKIKESYISELTIIADDDLHDFLNQRPMDCHILERCTTMIEKGAIKILRVFMESGSQKAKELLNSYLELSKKAASERFCPDDKCLTNAMKVFESIKKLIDSAHQNDLENIKNLDDVSKNLSDLEDIGEECELISPLSNEKRIKILKILSRGSLYYNQLEDTLGIKGGHFHFHLEKLIEASYIKQEKDKGPYSITISGMRALKLLYDLKEDISLTIA